MHETNRRKLLAAAAVVVVAFAAVIAIQSGNDGCGDPILSVAGEGVALRETTDGPEVVVSAENDFTVGALAWILRIGRLEFDRSYYPEGSLTELAFPIPAEAVALLEDGDGIAVRYGNPLATTREGFAPADSTVDRSSGFATVRIADDC